MAAVSLLLDSKKHVYNPKFRTFHITMNDLYSADRKPECNLEWMRDVSVAVRNLTTGNMVEFKWVGRGPHCNLYIALYGGETYCLMVWADMETMRLRYTAKVDLYAVWRQSPQLVLAAYA